MMVTQRHRRTREVTGPTPHSVAIFARPPTKRPPEHLILERRRQEDQRQQANELTQYNKISDLRNDWEKQTDRKIQRNTVKRRVQNYMQANDFAIEDRRERLRELLRQEENGYLEEMENKEETVLERQAKMRQRAKHLKEMREAERIALVQEKLEQQWRDQCEEMRSTISKRQQDQVAAERMEQLRINDDIRQQRREEEDMYAKLWESDMMAKAAREEQDTKRQMSANMDTLAVLQRQMAAVEAQKQEEKWLVEEEARLLKEQAQLRKVEEQRLQEEKRIKQQEIRDMYDRSLDAKRDKQAREMQEQLAFDMKILEELLEESRNEAKAMAQRKKELREEDRTYREYLTRLQEEEQQKERMLDRMCDAEVEKMWEKRLKQWKLEKEARQKLLQDVLASRRRQIEERLIENEMRKGHAQSEREDLMRKIAENKQSEQETRSKVLQANKQFQDDLLSQANYNRRVEDLEREELEREWSVQREAELEYRRKLDEALRNPQIDKIHPMRRQHSQRSQQGQL